MTEAKEQKHFVLVHGLGHGAWTWYKVKPRLESFGHRVTVFDLEASGINTKEIQDVETFHAYTNPLFEILASLSENEKVILVGHSLGGLNLALAADRFPEKISVAVYLTALLPDTQHEPSYVLDQFFQFNQRMLLQDEWSDMQSTVFSNRDESSLYFGPKSLSLLYHLSPIEDLELAKSLFRLGSLFRNDLSKTKKFSNEKYGLVPRVYILCEEDKLLTIEFQKSMIENSSVNEVISLEGSDHMPMFSKPQQVCDYLSQIAQKYT